MKLVVAVIKPFKLEEVKAALEGVGVQGLTVTDARGFGRQRGHTEVYRGAEYQVELLPKTRVEVLADDDAVEDVVKAIVDGENRSGATRLYERAGMTRGRTWHFYEKRIDAD